MFEQSSSSDRAYLRAELWSIATSRTAADVPMWRSILNPYLSAYAVASGLLWLSGPSLASPRIETNHSKETCLLSHN
jgi:hypothetical protein